MEYSDAERLPVEIAEDAAGPRDDEAEHAANGAVHSLHNGVDISASVTQ